MTAGSPVPRAAPSATQYRSPGYSGTDCAIYAAFPPDPALPFAIEPNPDISGIGVILAFLITAYATLLFTICAYWTGLVPDELLNTVDKRIFRATSRRAASSWSKAFRGALRACSDQQMVTGIAVLAAAFAGIHSVTVYHWRTVIYLGWMSSNVHLNTLTVAMAPHWSRKGRSRGATAARFVRLAGMLTLFVLLVAALVPTVSLSFNNALANHPSFGSWWIPDTQFFFTPADPAACFWLPTYTADGPSPDAVMSLVMLTGSYAWKAVGLLFRPQQRALLRCDALRTTVPQLLRRTASWRLRKNCFVRAITSWPYSLLVGAYAMFVAACDFAASFAASLTILAINLAWGSINLLLPRETFAEYIGPDENSWAFGQVLPMLLLLLPLVSVVEEFSVATHNEGDQEEVAPRPKPSYSPNWAKETTNSTTTRPRTETFELPLLSHRRTQSSSAAASASRTGTAATSSSSSSASQYRFPTYDTGVDHVYSLGKAGPPTSIHEVSTSHSDLERNKEDHGRQRADEREKTQREANEEILYASRFFCSLVWLTVFCVFLAATWVLLMQCTNLLNGLGENRVYYNAGIAGIVATGMMLIWIALGSSFSNVDKLL